jgi:predicted dehydrogenase
MYRGFFPLKNQIRYDYELAGGSLLDIGTYGVTAIREAFGAEPVECLDAKARMHLDSDTIDEGLKATFRFPNGGTGRIDGDLARQGWMGLPKFEMPKILVEQRGVEVKGSEKAGDGEVHYKARTVTYLAFSGPMFWHKIEIVDKHAIRRVDNGNVVKSWVGKESKTAYRFEIIGDDGQVRTVGDYHWSTYRQQLEQFVNKIRGRQGSGVWINGVYSINQMKVADTAYQKAGLPIRPTSSYR